jgi:hypothetical protein
MQPQLKYTRSDDAHHIWLQGHKDIQCEPHEVHLHFPGGIVSITRCTDNTYWIHADLLDIKDPDNGNKVQVGRVVGARIDCAGMHVNDANTGDLANPALEHLAIRIEPI